MTNKWRRPYSEIVDKVVRQTLKHPAWNARGEPEDFVRLCHRATEENRTPRGRISGEVSAQRTISQEIGWYGVVRPT